MRTLDGAEALLGGRVLVRVALVGDIASHDNEVGLSLVNLADSPLEEGLLVARTTGVHVRELRDQHETHSDHHPRTFGAARPIACQSRIVSSRPSSPGDVTERRT
jgi:hypothetical protein